MRSKDHDTLIINALLDVNGLIESWLTLVPQHTKARRKVSLAPAVTHITEQEDDEWEASSTRSDNTTDSVSADGDHSPPPSVTVAHSVRVLYRDERGFQHPTGCIAIIGEDYAATAHAVGEAMRLNSPSLPNGSTEQPILTGLKIGLEFEYDVKEAEDTSIAPQIQAAMTLHRFVARQVGDVVEQSLECLAAGDFKSAHRLGDHILQSPNRLDARDLNRAFTNRALCMCVMVVSLMSNAASLYNAADSQGDDGSAHLEGALVSLIEARQLADECALGTNNTGIAWIDSSENAGNIMLDNIRTLTNAVDDMIALVRSARRQGDVTV
jgi:hypothetical protein